MSAEAERERAFWDAQAATLEAAKRAIWSDPTPGSWEADVDACLEQILPALERGVGARKARSKARILDLGCGMGRLTLPVARHFSKAEVVGVDISAPMLDRARKAAADAGLDDVRLELGDGRALPAVGPLNAAYSMITLQHMPWDAQAGYIAAVAAALKPGGVFRFQVVEGDERVFLSQQTSEAAVRAACEAAGLEVEAVDRGAMCPVWIWVTAVKPAAGRGR